MKRDLLNPPKEVWEDFEAKIRRVTPRCARCASARAVWGNPRVVCHECFERAGRPELDWNVKLAPARLPIAARVVVVASWIGHGCAAAGLVVAIAMFVAWIARGCP